MLVKQIKDEVDEADELKESEADVKRKIQLVEDQVLNGEVCTKKAKKIKPAQGWGTRKDINGVITGENLSKIVKITASKTAEAVASHLTKLYFNF
jgi:hypothetical protein